MLDLKNLFEMTLSIQCVPWGEPLQPMTANDDLRLVIQDRNSNADLERFDRTFFALSSLALPEAIQTYGGDLTAHLAQIWDERIETQYLYLLMKQTWFADFTHISIELCAQAPFLVLYSQYFAKSLDSVTDFVPSTRSSAKGHSLRCMRWNFAQ